MQSTTTSEAGMISVTVIGPNLQDQSKGTFHVHATGCADIRRMASRDPEYRYTLDHPWTMDAETRDDVGDEIYSDHIAEGSMDEGAGKHDCHFFPCCSKLA